MVKPLKMNKNVCAYAQKYLGNARIGTLQLRLNELDTLLNVTRRLQQNDPQRLNHNEKATNLSEFLTHQSGAD